MLNPCRKCGATPVEQTRGQMKPEDHHMQHMRHGAVAELAEKHGVMLDVEAFRRDAFEVEDLGQEHATDMRVSCPGCGNHIGWDRKDIERFQKVAEGKHIRMPVTPDGNIQNIRDRWNAANPMSA